MTLMYSISAMLFSPVYAVITTLSGWLMAAHPAFAGDLNYPIGISMPGGPELLPLFGFGLFGILGTILWIFALVDLLTKSRLDGTEKIVWLLVIIFLHWLGALLYFIIKPGPGRRR